MKKNSSFFNLKNFKILSLFFVFLFASSSLLEAKETPKVKTFPTLKINVAQDDTIKVFMQDLRNVPNFAQLDSLVTCGGADTLALLIYTNSPTPILDLKLTLKLPNGLEYGGFAFAGRPGSQIDPFDVSNARRPIFNVPSLSADNILIAYIAVRANCNANPSTSAYKITFEANYTVDDNGLTKNCKEVYTPDAEYNNAVKVPVLNMLSVSPTAQTITTYNQASKCHTLTISQDGIDAYLSKFDFYIDSLVFEPGYTLSSLKANNVNLPYTYDALSQRLTAQVTGSFFQNNTDPLNRPKNNYFNTSETMTIQACFNVTSCINTNIRKYNYSVNYRCDDYQDVYCQLPSTKSATVKFTPNFGATPVAESHLVQGGQVCGNNIIVAAKFKSTVTDSARGLYENLVLKISNCQGNNIDIASVKIAGNVIPSTAYSFASGFITVDFTKLIADPDGVGVGLTDVDGDGKFDDLPGGKEINMLIEFAVACPSLAGQICVPNSCTFSNVSFTGLRHCGQAFQQTVNFTTTTGKPQATVSYGSVTTNNPPDVVSNIPTYNFGTVGNGTHLAKTKNVEFCYTFSENNLTSCQNPSANYAMVTFFSKTAEDVQISNAVFAGSTPSNAPISMVSSSQSERTFKINLGNGLAGIQQCYSFDMTLDTNLCSPAYWSSIDFKVVEECASCSCTILKGCKSVVYYQDPNDVGCSCNIFNSVQLERYNYGFTDANMTAKVDTSTIPDIDKVHFLPGDTMRVVSTNKILRAADFNANLWSMDFNLYNRTAGASVAFYNRLRSIWDTRAVKIVSAKVKKLDGTIYDLKNVAYIHASPEYDEDDRPLLFIGPDNGDDIRQVAFGNEKLSYATSNSSDDRQDFDRFQIVIRNYADVTYAQAAGNQYIVNRKANGITPLLNYIGGLADGDEFIFEYLIPIIRNPLFDESLGEVTSIVTSRMGIAAWDNLSGQSIGLDQQCSTDQPYFFWDPKISLSTKVVANDCDGYVEHLFKVSNPYPTGETWFTKEYRPFIGFESINTTIPAPFIYGGNAEWLKVGKTLGNGQIIEPDSIANNPLHAVFAGNDYYVPNASGANKIGLFYSDAENKDGVNGGVWAAFNAQGFRPDGYAPGDDISLSGGSLPMLAVGLNQTDSLKLHIPLLRICPTPINLSDFNIAYKYAYPYLPNYDTFPFAKNDYNGTGASIIWGAGQTTGYWYTDKNRNEAGNSHRFSASQAGGQYLILDNTQTFPDLLVNVTSGLLVDLQGQNEVNTYTIEASNAIPSAATLTNVVTSISLPNSIQLVKIETSGGANVAFTQVGSTDTTKIYSFSNPNLAPGNTASYKIFTEQLFCTTAPKICLTTVGGCNNPALTAAILGQTDGNYCSAASDCYFYESEESGIQAEWTIEALAEQDLCAETQYGIRIKNVKPSLLMNLETMWWLPKGMEFVPGSWQVSYPNGPTVQSAWVNIPDPTLSAANSNLYGTAFEYTDDAVFSTFISNNGLKGISATSAVTDSNQISIRFKVKTLCEDFVSGTSLRFNVDAFGACEQTVSSGVAASTPLIIKNANPKNFAQILVVADPITLNCGAVGSPLSLTGLNLSKTGSTNATKMCVTLPVGVTYTGSGFKFETPANFVPANVEINTVGMSQELCFDVPDGIGPNQFFKLIIPVAADQNAACGKLELGVDINSYIAAQACNTLNKSCGVNVLNTVNPIVPFEILGPLNIENLSLETLCGATAGTVDYEYSMTLTNPGPAYNNTVTFQLIQDTNGNGKADDFEVPFDSDIKTVNLANGASTQVVGTMTTPVAGSCPIIFKALFNTTCNCDFREIYINEVKPKFFADLGEKVVLCPNEKLEFTKCGDYTYSLAPANGGTITETASTISVALNAGFGVSTPVTLTLSGGQSACIISESIAIYSTDPFEIGPYTAQLVCDRGSTLLDAKLSSALEGNVTILWSPSTYLDDPTSATPTITNPAADITYTVTITNLDGKCSASAQYPVLVKPLTLQNVAVGSCYDFNGTSYVDVNVTVAWRQPAPVNDSIKVTVGSVVKYIRQNSLTSPYTVTVPVPANGTTGLVNIAYSKKTSCNETAPYTLPDCRFGSIGDYVWYDENFDGVQGTSENPIAGAKVYLLSNAGVKIDSTLTDGTGKYLFDSLSTGIYKVQVAAPVGYEGFTKANKGVDTKDSDVALNGVSHSITIQTYRSMSDTLRNNPQIDAGLVRFGSIGNYVWFDSNANGQQDSGETPLQGVKVYLLNNVGATIDSAVTNVAGLYLFDSLLSGDYRVKFVVPTGYSVFTSADLGADDALDSDANTSGLSPVIQINTLYPDGDVRRDNLTIDAGVVRYGSIGNYVWFDEDGNGKQDASETPIAGVKVYLLNNLGVKIDSTLTDASGLYEFDNLNTGTYKVQFVEPSGYNGFTKSNLGGDDTKDSDVSATGSSHSIVIDVTKAMSDTLRNNPQIDAGLIRYGSIGNYVWFDDDADGVQDPIETPIAGIKVYLLNSTGTKIDSTVTDASGYYLFDSLYTAKYKVQFIEPSGYNGFTEANQNVDNLDSDVGANGISHLIDLQTKWAVTDTLRNNPQIDAGLVRFGSIGNYVWFDLNENGIQEPTEVPVAGVKIYLTNSAGIILDSTITDGVGNYQFDSLISGEYRVKFNLPPSFMGFTGANLGGDDAKDSDADLAGLSPIITINTSYPIGDIRRDNPTIDAGLIQYGSLGDYVWFDENANGIQEATEKPIPNVRVYLLNNLGVKIDSTVTDANGNYRFVNLSNGTYKIQFVEPAGYNGFTGGNKGSDDAKDSDVSLAGLSHSVTIDVSKTAADTLRNNPHIDAGLVRYGSIGDYVWYDKDADGIQDPTEMPIAGIKVYLLDNNGNKLDSTTTDATGKYLFDELIAGNYKIQFVAPTDYDGFTKQDKGTSDGTDSDVATNGISSTITIDTNYPEGDTHRDNITVDAGLIRYGSVGDYVWFDVDADGTQDPTETPVTGLKVYLLDALGNKIDSTVTNSSGLYKFDSLLDGTYQVKFTLPIGFDNFTAANLTDDAKDSDANSTGLSQKVVIDTSYPKGDTNRDNMTIDAGVASVASLGDYVWFDKNANGIQDPTETPIEGVVVKLLDASNNIIAETSTNSVGFYQFTGLQSGIYKVQFIEPDGYDGFTISNAGANDAKDSDVSKTGVSHSITIDVSKTVTDTLRNNPQIDAGLIRFGSIGDYVWYDKNTDGIQDGSETPVAGVKVYLLDANNNKLDSTLTDALGKYLFDSLLSGIYKVQFVASSEFDGFTKQDIGTNDTKDSDANSNGMSEAITIDTSYPETNSLRNNTRIDAGLIRYGSLGDYVWFDANRDGLQDITEQPIANTTVYLLDAAGTLLDSTKTDVVGKYSFDSLGSGMYRVQFVRPTGYDAFTTANQGTDISDSDVNNLGLVTGIIINTDLPKGNVGRDNPTIDAGLVVGFGSIGDYVWEDTNGDGVQQVTEPPVEGVKVYLLDGNGNKLDSTFTDVSGKYLFDMLESGTYQVQFVAPTQYEGFTTANQGNDSSDSDADTAGKSTLITIDTTVPSTNILRNNPTIDAGLLPRFGSIGDYVWFDTNANGMQDVAELPIQNVKVYLLDNHGNKLDSTLTNSAGNYLFDSLRSGTYQVQFVTPIGYDGATKPNQGLDTKDSDVTISGLSQLITIDTSKPMADTLRNNPQIDAGFTRFGSIGDYVWNDENANGIQDSGEEPIIGVKVYLLDGNGNKLDSTLTDASGKYLFDSLSSGTYKVKFVAPSGYNGFTESTQGLDTTKDSNVNDLGESDLITINTNLAINDSGRNNPTIDAGLLRYGSIGDYVWFDEDLDGIQDTNEPFVSGVKIFLLDKNGAKLDSTLSDATGKYLFDSLLTGEYQIQFVVPAGFDGFTKQTQGSDTSKDNNVATNGLSAFITIDTSLDPLAVGRNNPTIDAGLVRFGSIGDYVWIDADKDGTQDSNELGLAGVKVYLLSASGVKLDSTVTDNSGKYLFDSLGNGSFIVQFATPSNYATTLSNTGDDLTDSDAGKDGKTHIITIDISRAITDTLRNNPTIDLGVVPVGSLGNYVWYDSDLDGRQDFTELPVQGIKVYLLNATTEAKLDSTVTNASGLYQFTNLSSGNYKIQFILPNGTKTTVANAVQDLIDSDADATGITGVYTIDVTKDPISLQRNNPSIDLGIVPVGSLGDYVWLDSDKDGIQDADESPIAGIKVYLFDQAGKKLDSTVTDAAGNYLFNNLAAGAYQVQFVAPSGKIFTMANTTVDTQDSDAGTDGKTSVVVIDTTKPIGDPARDNRSVDAGLVIEIIPYGSLGDYVWFDNNANGLQEATEPPVVGVKVYLLNASGQKIDSTLTNVSGLYLFDSLVSGTYQIQFIAPAGSVFTTENVGNDTQDSDATTNGKTQQVTINTSLPVGDIGRNNMTLDAGFIPPYGSIGDYVWNDTNKNGIQDANEPPAANVKVYLLDANGTKLDSTLTNANGLYVFDSLLNGSYQVQFIAPAGKEFTTPNATSDNKDSDAGINGKSDMITINTSLPVGDNGRDYRDADAGLILLPIPYGSIGDYVWDDTNKDGVQDVSENPVSGVKVYLLDANGTKIDSTITDILGKYLFDSLVSSTYKVQFVAPSGKEFTTANSTIDNKDSDAGANGLTESIVINTALPVGDIGRDNRDVDAGIVPKPLTYGSIGDYVWNDTDKDGVQDADESPAAGVKVYLLNANGTKLDSTLTDASGKYLFDSLVSGSYQVQFVAPSGKEFTTANSTIDTKDSDAGSNGKTSIITINTTLAVGDIGRDNRDVDAGLVPIPTPYGSIGDYVWNDADKDGVQDFNESPAAGVKVYLLDANGSKLDSTLTNTNGLYLFDSLLSGNYQIQFVAPAGKEFTLPNNTIDTKDSDADSTGKTSIVSIDTSLPLGNAGRDNRDVDAGIVNQLVLGSIGDYIWVDTNDNGLQDVVEAPVSGVKLVLWSADSSGNPIAKLDSTTTNSTGYYLFDELPAGLYIVQVVKSTLPTSATLTAKTHIGSDDTKDSDFNSTSGLSPVVTLKPELGGIDKDNRTIDGGIIVSYGSIGDYVWNDTNKDGVQDAGESPAAGVKVYLLNANGTKLDSTLTDASGKYLFDSLVSGNYQVQFVAPSGKEFTTANSTIDTKDSDAGSNGKTSIITINTTLPVGDIGRDNRDVDAGLVPIQISYGSIGDYVWNDTNKDGVQDAGESPAAGVKVYLLNANGTKLDSTLTDASGKYLFDSLVSGNYQVQFVAPSGKEFTTANSTIDTKDSDAGSNGKTSIITINTTLPVGDIGRDNRDVDAGLKETELPLGSIGDYVWIDANKNGIQDTGENPVSGIKLILWSADVSGNIIAKLDSETTNSSGYYLFTNLPAGRYIVQLITSTIPSGYVLTAQSNVGTNDAIDSDFNTSSGLSPVVTLNPVLGGLNKDNHTIDAGLVSVGSPKLHIQKIVNKNVVQIGDIVTYTISIWNTGTKDTSSVQVEEALYAGAQYISSVATNGIYNPTSKIWTVGTLIAKGDTAKLTVNVKVIAGGNWVNKAIIRDPNGENEDDSTGVCLSAIIPICSERGETMELLAPLGYASYQWYNNNQPIGGATMPVYIATKAGSYTVKVNNGQCPAEGCCPIIIAEVCECPAEVCVPVSIQRKR